ncbi:hypothetical protein Tco_0828238 [Tanacetum coccineum]
MLTEMELTLEQTQQGVSYEVLNIRVNLFTMKMEILLESISNKLMVEHAEYDESNTYVLERFNTTAGNPVKKILLKLNLSDHRLFKMMVEVPDSCFYTNPKQMLIPTTNVNVLMKAQVMIQDFRYSDTTHLSRSVKVFKVKEFQEDAIINAFLRRIAQSKKSMITAIIHRESQETSNDKDKA